MPIRSPELSSAIDERDELKIQLHLLHGKGASAETLHRLTNELARLTQRIDQLRKQLCPDQQCATSRSLRVRRSIPATPSAVFADDQQPR